MMLVAIIAWWLTGAPTGQPDTVADIDTDIDTDIDSLDARPVNPAVQTDTDPSLQIKQAATGGHQHAQHAHTASSLSSPSAEEIAALLDKHLTPAMREEINDMLSPPPQGHEVVIDKNGGHVEMGSTAATVMVAVIDDSGNTVVTDIVTPLDTQPNTPNTPMEQK